MGVKFVDRMIVSLGASGSLASGREDLKNCYLLEMEGRLLRRAELARWNNAGELAEAAAFDALGRVMDRQMRFTTAAYERNLLASAGRRQKRMTATVGHEEERVERDRFRSSGAVSFTWAPGWAALFRFLILTRRSWVYLMLAAARSTQWGWRRQLTGYYLGQQNRQPQLNLQAEHLRRVVDELEDVSLAHQGGYMAGDLAQMSRGLLTLTAPDSKDAKEWRAYGQRVLAARLAFRDPDFPSLCGALGESLRLSPDWSSNEADRLLNSWWALTQEMTTPSEPLVDNSLTQWLECLPPRPARDRPPTDVLAGIRSIPVLESAGEHPVRAIRRKGLTLSQAQSGLYRWVEKRALARAVLDGLQKACDRDGLPRSVKLPPPCEVTLAEAAAAVVYLNRWSKLTGTDLEGLEAPVGLQEYGAAVRVLSNWATACPEAWPAEEEVRKGMTAALVVVGLDQLSEGYRTLSGG